MSAVRKPVSRDKKILWEKKDLRRLVNKSQENRLKEVPPHVCVSRETQKIKIKENESAVSLGIKNWV